MSVQNSSAGTPPREAWEDEVFFGHRWGAHGEKASEEHARLRRSWDAAQPFPAECRSVLDDTIALEICNWNLEESILELCSAIGEKRPTRIPIGHMGSVTHDRWRQVWAYYLTLRNWLPCGGAHGHEALLRQCDPDGAIQKHILGMLGERTDLKELYVERVCHLLGSGLAGTTRTDRPSVSLTMRASRRWKRRVINKAEDALKPSTSPASSASSSGRMRIRTGLTSNEGEGGSLSSRHFARYVTLLLLSAMSLATNCWERRRETSSDARNTFASSLAPRRAWTSMWLPS